MELLALIFVIIGLISKFSKKSSDEAAKKAQTTAPPLPPKAQTPSSQAVQQKVNQHLFGSSQQPRDKYSRYRRFIEQDRYTDLEKLGHELNISKYQAAREIKDLQKEGYFKNVMVDDRNYKLIYPAAARPAARTTPAKTAPIKAAPVKTAPIKKEEPERSFVQASAPYRPERNAARRHERWMELPPGTHEVTCHYCGASNAVPNNHRVQYTCYFCREEL